MKLAKVIVILLLLCCLNACQSPTQSENGVNKITFWHGINPPENRDVFNELLAKFNENNPEVQVEAIYIGQPDQQIPKIISSVVGNQPPDLLWYVPQITGKLLELGAIKPLGDWLENSSIKTEIIPVMLTTMELNGEIWSIPFATNNAAMFYRPSLFTQAGITKLPETWSELAEVAGKLTKDLDGDGKIDQHGLLLSLGKGEWTVFVWLPFIYSAEGELLVENKPQLVNAGTVKALEFGRDLVETGVANLSPPERGYELDQFIAGKVAMQITGPWTLGQLNQTGIDFDAFPIPALATKAAVLGGENIFLFKTNPAREAAALKFLEYILSEEFQTEWAIKSGYLPINIKAEQSETYQAFLKANPILEVFIKQMEWARSRPIISNYTTLSENLGRAIEASLLGQTTPEESLAASQKRLEAN
ncbi:ABC transporter substrate-binding protein [Gloeocapsa sp. PCC 73106]|uniref:ABC transporter substrate-binding protein n=1 Tax=Gloeocapsa sp. PCC 73106 TaxID=102232 RepID=UPI0002ACB09C|nr:ABC transporter substrate-binding protein [Gloeocapsa sp. PCC 73106]ELR98373.1 ABC-type sugar transport system, periplasmic component [Gloeocapsa sp. PCC 73106]